MSIVDEINRIQQQIQTEPSNKDQLEMLEEVTRALESVGVSLETKFEISLSARTNPPIGYYSK